MKKTIGQVFGVIAILVLILIVWANFFNDDGILETGWNALVSPINNTWQKITGSNTNIIPVFSNRATNLDDAQDAPDGGSGGD